MRKTFLMLALLSSALFHRLPSAWCAISTINDAEATFVRLAEEFIDGYLAWRPQIGTALGLHQYDGKLTDFSRASVNGELERLKRFDRQLAALDANSLTRQSYYDLRVLRTAIQAEIFRFEEMESYFKNPMTYAGVLDLNIYIKRNFAPLEERV